MDELQMMENYGLMSAMNDRWNIMYNENRSPIYSVQHYISYLRKYVSETGYARTTGSSASNNSNSVTQPRILKGGSREAISPVSYFLRKLKLDLKLAYANFVAEFIEAPNNGLRLLLALLKNLQILSSKSIGSLPRSEGRGGTPRMDEYKRTMIDEQDCLLCIKYTLRIPNSTEELLDDNAGLLTVTTCLLSNYSKSRVTALEILTLIITGPTSVDKVLEAFTSIRLQYGEATRFKMLTSMTQTRGVAHVLFQVNCLRFLNSLLNMCRSSNMRVFLQYEMEEAGLNLDIIQKNAQGDGLEFDDLRKEIKEWKTRYIDVDTLLRKIKADLKKEFQSEGLSEYYFDQKYGNRPNTGLSYDSLSWVTPHEQGYLIDYDKWIEYVQSKQKDPPLSNGPSAERLLRRDVYIPDPHNPNKTLTSQSQLTDDKIPSPTQFSGLNIESHGKYKVGQYHDNDDSSLYDVMSVTTSVNGSDITLNNEVNKKEAGASQKEQKEIKISNVKNQSIFVHTEQKSSQEQGNELKEEKNWILRRSDNQHDNSLSPDVNISNSDHVTQENIHDETERYDSGVSMNDLNPDSKGYSIPRSSETKSKSFDHIFYNPDNHPNDGSTDIKSDIPILSRNSKSFDDASHHSQFNQQKSYSDNQNNDKNEKTLQRNNRPKSLFARLHEANNPFQENKRQNLRNSSYNPPTSRRAQTPPPDYNVEESPKAVPLKTSTTRSRVSMAAKRIDALESQNKKVTETNKTTSSQSSNISSKTNHANFRSKPVNQNNLSPRPFSLKLKQNGFSPLNQNSSHQTDAKKQSVFEDKVILNVNPNNDSEEQKKNLVPTKEFNGNIFRQTPFQNFTPQKINQNKKEDGEIYSCEVNKVLQGLDKTLEQNGWKDSLKSTKSTKVPFVAYI